MIHCLFRLQGAGGARKHFTLAAPAGLGQNRRMIRRALVLMTVLVAAGCAAKGTQPRTAPRAIPDAPPRGEPAAYYNMPAAALRVALGAPAFVRKDGATEMWRYDGAACRAFFFFYGPPTQQVVRHVETLPRGVKLAADSACLTALQAAPAKTS